MTNFHFTPTEEQSAAIPVPYLEEARADFAPYYRAVQTIKQAQQAVITELGKLGGAAIVFQEGYFGAANGN